jgi:hypothetical protein
MEDREGMSTFDRAPTLLTNVEKLKARKIVSLFDLVKNKLPLLRAGQFPIDHF